MRRALLACLAPVLAAGCVPRATIPDAERSRVIDELAGQKRWLRVACWVGPFFGDRSRALLSDQPFSELDLLETGSGEPIAPPAAERALAPGTPVRIRTVEFPTGMVIASRIVMTPRYHPWVLLDVPGDSRPHVLVLSQTVATYDQVRAEIDRVLAPDDPTRDLQALSPAIRDAVLRKSAVEGMTPQALTMAWGYPEKKIVDRPAGTEEWIWAGGRRRAFLQDDRLLRWELRLRDADGR